MQPAKKIHPRLARARAALVMSQPFFGVQALQLIVIEAPEIGTMATDGKRLYYAPQFVDSHTDAELLGVVAHEVLHNVYLHHTRRQWRDAKLWNIAADFAINADLLRGGFTLPKSRLYDARFEAMSAETIYQILADELAQEKKKQGGKPQPGQGTPGGGGDSQGEEGGNSEGEEGNASGHEIGGRAGGYSIADLDSAGCGAVIDAAETGAEIQDAEREALQRVMQAAAVAKAAGKLPGFAERYVSKLHAPRVDWRETLRRFVDSTTSFDYTWARPSIAHIASGRTLPGVEADATGEIVCIVDTSGSIGGDELTAFLSEIQGIADSDCVSQIVVAYADTQIQSFDVFDKGEAIKPNANGGGGTCFRQPMQWRAENFPDAAAIVYLTDMVTSDFGDDYGTPVLWVSYGKGESARQWAAKAPFGESVFMFPD